MAARRTTSSGPETPMEAFQDEAVRRAVSELQQDSKTVADNLRGDLPVEDVVSPGRKQYLEYFRNSWDNPDWRTRELDRIGPQNFLHAAYAAFGLQEPNWKQVQTIPTAGSSQASPAQAAPPVIPPPSPTPIPTTPPTEPDTGAGSFQAPSSIPSPMAVPTPGGNSV